MLPSTIVSNSIAQNSASPWTPPSVPPYGAQLGGEAGQGAVAAWGRPGRGPARAAGRQDTWVSQEAAELRAVHSGGEAVPQSCSRREVSCHFC